MKGDYILMSQKQLQRFRVIGLVEAEKMTLREAAEKMGVCYRQAKRIGKRVREKGVQGLMHGNTGRCSGNRVPEKVKERVLELSGQKYEAFNDRHFWEELLEVEGIAVGRETVRKMRRAAGICPKRKRRPPQHRKRRERRGQEGSMVIWDGSPHAWLGPDQAPCCLMAALDDATGTILAARFFSFEGTEGYLWLLRQVVSRYGIPLSIYQDRHGSLKRNDDHWSLEEELAGVQEPTQVGQALKALGIHPIFALSPQAKGRIERLFGILQDRWGAELTSKRVTSLSQANALLPGLISRYNRRFALRARQSEKAWRPIPNTLDVDQAISFHYPAKVGLDNTVRLGGLILDLPPGPYGRSYAKARVEVRQLLNGSWRVYYQSVLIAKHPSTALREPLRALARKRSPAKGTKSYHWVYQSSAQPIYDYPFT
jgi:transposase